MQSNMPENRQPETEFVTPATNVKDLGVILGRLEAELAAQKVALAEMSELKTRLVGQEAELQELRQQVAQKTRPFSLATSHTSRRALLKKMGGAAAGVAALSLAAGLNPVSALADDPAIDADGGTNAYGAQLKGGLASARLVPATTAGQRASLAGRQAGELYVDTDKNLYYFNGTAWTQLTGGTTYLPSPFRMIGDTNTTSVGIKGFLSLAVGTPVDVPATGAISGGFIIPDEATSVVGTLTAFGASNVGFVTMYPADAPQPVVANITYSANPSFISTAVSVKLGTIAGTGKKGFKVVAGNSACTIAFDVVSYSI